MKTIKQNDASEIFALAFQGRIEIEGKHYVAYHDGDANYLIPAAKWDAKVEYEDTEEDFDRWCAVDPVVDDPEILQAAANALGISISDGCCLTSPMHSE